MKRFLRQLHSTSGGLRHCINSDRVVAGIQPTSLDSTPSRHFERVNWWEDHSFKIKKGAADPIDFAVWRVQVRLGANPRSDLLTWDLVEHPRDGSWAVRDVA